MIERLDDRPAGSALPADVITWEEDGTNIGPNAYTWTVKAYAATDTTFATALFTKPNGDLTLTATTIRVDWKLTDLPTLAAGDYKIRLTGTLATLSRIHDLSLKLT